MAIAIQALDPSFANRIVLENNGFTGENLAKLLQAFGTIKDFKSLTYKKNAINEESIGALKSLLRREIPFHLEELKLIDLKITNMNLMVDLIE